jgi:hypothetical protein
MSSANTLGKYINKVLDSQETHMLPTNCTEHAYFREHLQIQSSSYPPCLDHNNTTHIEGKPQMDPNNSQVKVLITFMYLIYMGTISKRLP